MRRYRTVVPLHNVTLDGNKPYQFAPCISIDHVPDNLRKDSTLERQSFSDLQELNTCTHALIFEYEADVLDSPDPEWKGKKPRAIEQGNVEKAYLATLALWLQHPSPVGFTLAFHMAEYEDFIIQGSLRVDPFLCHPDNKDDRIIRADLEPAKQLFEALAKIQRQTSLWTALRALTGALQMNSEEVRYLLLWVAIEALFGANFEIKYRISQRLAFFISKDRAEARERCDAARKAYDFRSKVVHGAWNDDPQSTALTASTEALLRSAMLILLRDEGVMRNFLGTNEKRDAYLDQLVFA